MDFTPAILWKSSIPRKTALTRVTGPIPPPPVAQGWPELIATIEKEITDIVGPEELFGQNLGAKEMTGILLKLKQGAGLVGLRNIFDRLNQMQMYVGDIMLEMALNNFGVGKIQHIIGEQPSELIQSIITPENQLQKMAAGMLKYNCTVEEAELTSTQRGLQFMQALQMKQMGIPISNKYLLEKSTLQGKREIMEDIQQQEQQAQQMQQQQFASEMKQAQVLARSLEAKAQSDFAGAKEKEARAISDIGLAKHHEALAISDRAQANLNNAKAISELDEMPENRLIKLMDAIMTMEEREHAMTLADNQTSEATAARASADVNASKAESKPQNGRQ
jgi:hypothetical protein